MHLTADTNKLNGRPLYIRRKKILTERKKRKYTRKKKGKRESWVVCTEKTKKTHDRKKKKAKGTIMKTMPSNKKYLNTLHIRKRKPKNDIKFVLIKRPKKEKTKF